MRETMTVLGALDIEHISATQIGMYQRCPRQWAYRYVLKVKSPPDAAILCGSGMHHAAEVGMLEKSVTGENPKPDDAADAARDYVANEFAAGEVVLSQKDTRGGIVDKAVRLTRKWAEDAAPLVEPVGVEQSFDTEISGVKVIGRFDVVTDSSIIDWKSSSRKPARAQIANSPQTEVYALVSGRAVNYIYVVDSVRNGPAVHEAPLTDDEVNTARAVATATVEDVSAGMASGVWPRNRNGWHCSPDRCGYYRRCMASKDDSTLREMAQVANA
jgi:RecB family exonuclease